MFSRPRLTHNLVVILLAIGFPGLLSADMRCIDRQVLLKNLTSLRKHWDKFDRATLKSSWSLTLTDVFCPDDPSVQKCDGLSFTQVDGHCACGVTFYLDENDLVDKVVLVQNFSAWSEAISAAREYVMAMMPLFPPFEGAPNPDQGWDVADSSKEFSRSFSWTGEKHVHTGNICTSQVDQSVHLSIYECSPGNFSLNLYVQRPEKDVP